MATNLVTPEAAMTALGFTEIEATIYCELLRSQPSTGYRLAKAVGKAAANTYQALSNLTAKGAVMVDEGQTRAYRATPPTELLASLQRSFQIARHEAQAALEALHADTKDDRIYQLKTPAQIYERAEAMITRSEAILLFDLFPEPLNRLQGALIAAHGRGVVVAGLVYGNSLDLPFAVATSHSSPVVAERWHGLQLSLAADAREHLTALLSPDGLSAPHGVWSDSAYLACLKHSGLAAEIQISAAPQPPDQPFGRLSLLRAYPPGLARLLGPRPALQT